VVKFGDHSSIWDSWPIAFSRDLADAAKKIETAQLSYRQANLGEVAEKQQETKKEEPVRIQ
jgi:hypothetical protein